MKSSVFERLRVDLYRLARLKRHVLNVFAALAGSFALTAAGASAWTSDPNPAEVSVNYYFPPSELIQLPTYNLVYEIHLTSYFLDSGPPGINHGPIELEELDAVAGTKTFTYTGAALTTLMKPIGLPGFVGTDRIINPGQSQVIFVTLHFAHPADIPTSIEHTLKFRYQDGSVHALQAPTLLVSPAQPIIVSPPLRGSNWLAGDASHNGAEPMTPNAGVDAAHRREVLVENGKPYLAQRYAIDFIKYKIINGVGQSYSGPVNLRTSYFCYGQEIHSVAAGRVVEVLDGLPENVPQQAPIIPINFHTVGGNHVIVDIGDGHYAFYAHMIPHSMPANIKVGAYVAAGQVLGHVGDSGSASEPHLHFHIVDGPSFLGADGLPYAFDRFAAGAPVTLSGNANGSTSFTGFGPLQNVTNDYPQSYAPVSF